MVKAHFYDACGISSWQIWDGGSYVNSLTFDCTTTTGSPTVFVMATDVNGNSSSPCPATVNLIDEQPPIASCDEVEISLGAGVNGVVPIHGFQFDQNSYDACSSTLTFEYSINGGADFYSSINFNCDSLVNSPYSVVVKVADGAGNESFCLTTLEFFDYAPPVLTCPGPVTIQCDDPDGIDPSNTGFATALDNCAGVVTPIHTDLPSMGMSKMIYNFFDIYHPSNWTYNNGGSSTANLNLSNSPWSMSMTSSNDGGTTPMGSSSVQFSTTITGNVTGSSQVCFSWNFSTADPGNEQFGYRVNSGPFQNIASSTSSNYMCLVTSALSQGDVFTFEVLSSNQANGAGTVDIFNFQAPAMYNDANCQVVRRRWDATDGINTGVCFQDITVVDYDAPIFEKVLPIGTIFECSDTLHSVTVEDNCDKDIAVYTDTMDSRIDYSVTPPAWWSGYAPGECGHYNYSIYRRYSISDNCGNYDYTDKTVSIQDTEAPFFTYGTTLQVLNEDGQCSEEVNLDLTNDIIDCVPIDYLTVTYQVTLNVNTTPSTGSIQNGYKVTNLVLPVGVHEIEFKANDVCNPGLVTSHVVTVTVLDKTSPQASCQTGPIPITLISPSGTASVSPAQVNNGSSDDCGIQIWNVNPSSFDCSSPQSPSTIPVTLTVTDGGGNSSSCTTSVIISNTAPPVITIPVDITVECNVFDQTDPSTSGGSATASSSCGGVPTITYTDVNTVYMADGCRTITRTWTAVSGGSTSLDQIITVEDNIAPVIANVPNVTVECDAIPTVATPSVTEACGLSNVNYLGETSNRDLDPSNPGTGFGDAVSGYCIYRLRREWTTNDGCGNSGTEVQFINVRDTKAPVIDIPGNMFTFKTAPSACDTTVFINLLNYISDCALPADLFITSTGSGTSGSTIFFTFSPGTYGYTLDVADPCGNAVVGHTFSIVVEDNQAPQAACDDPITLVLDGNGEGSLTPADIDDGSTDNCDATAPITLAISPDTFDDTQAGMTVPVTLTVTDGAGLTNTCVTPVTIVDRGTVAAPNLQGMPGDMISIPITVTGFDALCAATFSVHVDNPLAVSVIGVSGLQSFIDPLEVKVLGNDVTCGWADPSAETLLDGEVLFYIDVELIGAIGTSSTVTINGTPTLMVFGDCVGGSLTPVGISGEVNIVSNPTSFILDGMVFTPAPDSDPVELVDFTLGLIPSGTAGVQLASATNAYSFSVPSGADRSVIPFKDINDCNVGFIAFDLSILKQYVLGDTLILPTQYHLIAADINSDGVVNVIDQLELQIIALNGTGPGFCIGFSNNTSWRFVDAGWVPPAMNNPYVPSYPESVSYSNITSDMTNNFIGIKIADLDFNADATSFTDDPQDGEERSDGLTLMANDAEVVIGNEYRVEITSSNFHNMEACQMTFAFDVGKLQFKAIEVGVLPEMTAEENFGLYHLDEGYITSIWYNSVATTANADEVLFTLVFEGLGNGQLSELLRMGSIPLVTKAMNSSHDYLDIELVFNSATNTDETANKGFILYQNRPNPFGLETVIPFYLSASSQTTLTITDVSGKIVKIINSYFGQGNHEFRLDAEELPNAGVFFYTLETQQGTAVRKMILQR